MRKFVWMARGRARVAALAVGLAALAAALTLSSCGTPGAPQPPSLNLPAPVDDLAAARAGNQVTLTWTMPQKNTDKLLLKGAFTVRICRDAASASACGTVGLLPAVLSFAPKAAGTFTETLPAELTAGPPRLLRYFVELENRNGRSAGWSNAAEVLAGEAPAAVTGLTAEVRKRGVVLRWEPATGEAVASAIRLRRTLLTPPTTKPREGLLSPEPEPTEQNLLVEACALAGSKGRCGPSGFAPDRALDKSIRFGETYEYRAQRVALVRAGTQTLELDGPLSAPVRVEALDIFPPAMPAGLAAVATAGESGAGTARAYAIDLSWEPVTDADLAGYIVYRQEGAGGWERVSPAEPLTAPAFRDSSVLPGHTYRYAVSAMGRNGHESARSAEAQETVPSS